MKRIEKLEKGYLINEFQHLQISKNSLALLRHSILNLVHIGKITHKEKNEIEGCIDNIIYKEALKNFEDKTK